MIEINLLPDDLRKKESVKLVLPEIAILKVLPIVVGIFMALLALFIVIAGFQKVRMAAVRAEIAELSKRHSEMIRQKNETAEMAKKLQQLEALASRKVLWWKMMNALSDSVTKGVWLQNLSTIETQFIPPAPKTPVKKGAKPQSSAPVKTFFLKIEGSTMAQGQETAYVGKFIKELKDNPVLSSLFDNVELSDMNQRKIREYDVYDFVLLCKFKKEAVGKS